MFPVKHYSAIGDNEKQAEVIIDQPGGELAKELKKRFNNCQSALDKIDEEYADEMKEVWSRASVVTKKTKTQYDAGRSKLMIPEEGLYTVAAMFILSHGGLVTFKVVDGKQKITKSIKCPSVQNVNEQDTFCKDVLAICSSFLANDIKINSFGFYATAFGLLFGDSEATWVGNSYEDMMTKCNVVLNDVTITQEDTRVEVEQLGLVTHMLFMDNTKKKDANYRPFEIDVTECIVPTDGAVLDQGAKKKRNNRS